MFIATRMLVLVAVFSLGAATTVHADANAVARAHAEAFSHACAAGDMKTVLAMYEDDAIAVWPGQGEEAEGKAAIARIAAGLCGGKGPTPVLKSVQGRTIAKGYILTYGRWELPVKALDGTSSTTVIRTTEVLKETGGKWRYVVDHASIGMPAPPAVP